MASSRAWKQHAGFAPKTRAVTLLSPHLLPDVAQRSGCNGGRQCVRRACGLCGEGARVAELAIGDYVETQLAGTLAVSGHLDAMQVDYRLKQDWASETRAYDDGLQHVLLLADILAEGVVKQFPEKFQE